MLKLIFGIFFISNVFCAIVTRDPYYKSNRRVALKQHGDNFFDAFYNTNDFFNSFFNVNGKKHDLGADYQLTSDVYRKPNPFYTKKVSDSAEMKDFYPVYKPNSDNNNNLNNNTVQDTTNDVYDQQQAPPYDEKTNTYSYLPPSAYGPAPSTNYGPYPTQNPIPSSYGSQIHSTYGPPTFTSPGSASYYPHSSYGSQSYYPPTATAIQQPQQPYGLDQKAHEGLFAKLLKKIDLILISKMLLKLVIFKKIIKFIAIICLLLFIPTLKKKFYAASGGGDEDEDRNYKLLDSFANMDYRLKEVANFALTAIEGFESHEIPWCVGESQLYCRIQYMLDQIDLRYPGSKIFSLWFPALTTTTEAPKTTTSKSSKENVIFNDYIIESSENSSTENKIEN